MTQKRVDGRSIQKHDTEANWNRTNNFIPENGELIIYSDKNNMKMGDGSTNVKNLPFAIPDIQNLLNIFYPPGTIYSTDDANFNPNTVWGGTWEKIEGRVVIGANSSYPAKSTGGGTTTGGPSNNTSGASSGSTGGPSNNSTSSTAISVDQMPSHNHIFPSRIMTWDASQNQVSASGVTWSGPIQYYSPGAGVNYTGGSQGHTHTLNSHTHSLNSHTHTLSSHTHDITPPYYAAYIWKRIS